MFLTNISFVLSRFVVLEVNSYDKPIPSRIEKRENKNLDLKEAQIIIDDIAIKYTDADEALRAAEFLNRVPEVPTDLNTILKDIEIKESNFINEIKSGAFNLLVFFTNNPDDIKQFAEIRPPFDFKIMMSTNEADAKKLGVSFPSVFCYNASERHSFEMSIQSHLQAIISATSVRSFENLTPDNIRMFQGLEAKPLYYITNQNVTFEEEAKKYRSITVKTTDKAKIVFFKPQDVPVLDQLLELKPEEYPVLLLMDEKARYCCKNITVENMEEAINNLLSGKAPQIQLASRIPENNETALVKIINTHTLPKVRSDVSEDKFIVLHSPNCGYCKQLIPHLESLSKILKDKSIQFSIYTYNTLENENIDDLVYNTVPKIYFQKKNSDKLEEVSGARTVPLLLKYLSEHGDSAKINLDDFKEHLPEAEKEKEETKENNKEIL